MSYKLTVTLLHRTQLIDLTDSNLIKRSIRPFLASYNTTFDMVSIVSVLRSHVVCG